MERETGRPPTAHLHGRIVTPIAGVGRQLRHYESNEYAAMPSMYPSFVDRMHVSALIVGIRAIRWEHRQRCPSRLQRDARRSV
jgi:hypothetical protein